MTALVPTMSQEVSNLALHIVREMYGEQVAYVSKILLRNGPSTIVDIIARIGANFDHNQLCKILCILVQQNLVHTCLKEDKVTGIFEFDTAAAINNIRVPQMLEHVNMHYGGGKGGKDAETILNKLLVNGRLSETLVIEQTMAAIRMEEHLDDKKPEHIARIEHRRAQVRQKLETLCNDGYIVRIDTLEVKKRALKLPKGVNIYNAVTPKKPATTQADNQSTIKVSKSVVKPQSIATKTKKKKKNKKKRVREDMEGMNAVHAAVRKKKKKKKVKNKPQTQTFKTKPPEEISPPDAEGSDKYPEFSPPSTAAPSVDAMPETEPQSSWLHSEFNYRANFAPFLNRKRRDVCIHYVDKLKGSQAGLVISTIFELVEERGELGDRSRAGIHLSYSKVVSSVQRAAKRNLSIGPMLQEQVIEQLEMLADAPLKCVHTINETGEIAGAQTLIFHSDRIVDCVRESTIEQVIRQKHQPRALRLYSILKQTKYLDEAELGKRAMMPLKKARECLFKLFCDKFVTCQEISQTSERAPKSTFFCWAVNKSSSLYPHLKSMLCKITLNVRLRRAHELETNQSLFDRKNNDLCATEEEVAKAGTVYGRLNRLDVTLIKLDEMMMTLFDF